MARRPFSHYSPGIIEEARAIYLGADGIPLGLRQVTKKLKEQYPERCKLLTHSTVYQWKRRYNWDKTKNENLALLRDNINQNVADAILSHSTAMQKTLRRYLEQLESGDVHVRPIEAVTIIKQIERLQNAENAKDAVVKEVATRLPSVLKKAGLNEKQRRRVLKCWINEMRRN
jgi:hypothetical protein|tara:strand:+ start:2157 stop:2675 length:519 start_codon:yes stop_codon:yes gene_type:complete